ncbi:MAG: peptidoglycan editing factor PgeF [Pseudomonadota bacterium]
MAEVEVQRAKVLEDVRHGFLGRRGGISTGAVDGLNVGLGTRDDPAAVSENRRRAVDAVAPGARLVTVYQVHSAECVTVSAPWPEDGRPQADALVTAMPGVVLGIVTADCAPVLLADPAAGVIGAAHAGWKGALAGIAEATIAAMERLGARRDRIAAAIGPCIAQASYEVDSEFRARFITGDAAAAVHFAAGRPGHWQFGLESYVAHRLSMGGISSIGRAATDTYALDGQFFSYRRATHRGEPDYGRQMSLIALA